MTAQQLQASRVDFTSLYSVLYDSIDTHIRTSNNKLRGWGIWEKWKSNGLRKRMTSYVAVSRIIYGKNINLTRLMQFLFQQFPFLTTYLTYKPHELNINIVYYTMANITSTTQKSNVEKEKLPPLFTPKTSERETHHKSSPTTPTKCLKTILRMENNTTFPSEAPKKGNIDEKDGHRLNQTTSIRNPYLRSKWK